MVGKMILFLLVVAAIGMFATSAMSYTLGLDGFPGYCQYPRCDLWCGAASCKMCMKWLPGNLCPDDMATIYNHCHANNAEAWAVDPHGLAHGMYDYSPPGYYYDDWKYDSRTGAIRGTALTIDMYDEGVPVVIRGSGHWVVQRGYTGAMSIIGNYYYNGTVVYGMYINDPLYPSCGGYVGGWKWWCAAGTWTNGGYFDNNVASSYLWGGHRASAERDSQANNLTHQHNGDSFNYY